jgi:hypothetical protein
MAWHTHDAVRAPKPLHLVGDGALQIRKDFMWKLLKQIIVVEINSPIGSTRREWEVLAYLTTGQVSCRRRARSLHGV